MSGVIGQILLKNNLDSNFYYLSPPFHPCPTSTRLANDYYIKYSDIIKKILSIKKIKYEDEFNLDFTEIHMWPEFDYEKYLSKSIYGNNS